MATGVSSAFLFDPSKEARIVVPDEDDKREGKKIVD